MAPLCETTATPGGWNAASVCVTTKVSGMPSTWLTMPRQFGPWITMRCSRAISASFSCSARPCSPLSANPAVKMIRLPTFRCAQATAASTTPSRGIESTAQSIPSGSASIEARHRRPRISSPLRVHEIDISGKIRALEIRKNSFTERSGSCGCADHRNGTRMQETTERRC